MHHKAIKAEIRKQLKTQYSDWQCLTTKEKKAIAKKVFDEFVKYYDFKQDVTTARPNLTKSERKFCEVIFART
ncbi:MAG: hypothetical protein DRH24_15915 [Deltaproteobacteria bacterium]|nr:MAG: hypothetical protein DRH24_15915 [Deltaproteobacteria bacterium]